MDSKDVDNEFVFTQTYRKRLLGKKVASESQAKTESKEPDGPLQKRSWMEVTTSPTDKLLEKHENDHKNPEASGLELCEMIHRCSTRKSTKNNINSLFAKSYANCNCTGTL